MTIGEQAKARGVPVPIGATAAELRADGWEVPLFVLDEAVLDTRQSGDRCCAEDCCPGEQSDYVWRGWRKVESP